MSSVRHLVLTYSSLREAIRGVGATLIEEQVSPEAFGGAFAVFGGRFGGQFRLVWDGKDRVALLQVADPVEQWRRHGPMFRDGAGPESSLLAEFRAAAEALTESGAQGEVVYVYLLSEGTEVWRPVAATRIGGSCFRLVGSVPDDERWQFLPGTRVHCQSRVLSDGVQQLVAMEAVHA